MGIYFDGGALNHSSSRSPVYHVCNIRIILRNNIAVFSQTGEIHFFPSRTSRCANWECGGAAVDRWGWLHLLLLLLVVVRMMVQPAGSALSVAPHGWIAFFTASF